MPYPSPTTLPSPSLLLGGESSPVSGLPSIDLPTPLLLKPHVTTLVLAPNSTTLALDPQVTEVVLDG